MRPPLVPLAVAAKAELSSLRRAAIPRALSRRAGATDTRRDAPRPHPLRRPQFSLFLRKAFIKALGYSDDALERPIVGITNTYSEFNPCQRPFLSSSRR